MASLVVPFRARIRGERISRVGVWISAVVPFLPSRVRVAVARAAVACTRIEVCYAGRVIGVHRMRLDPETLEISCPSWEPRCP